MERNVYKKMVKKFVMSIIVVLMFFFVEVLDDFFELI